MRRFYRPEDISQDRAYAAGYREVYASDEMLSLEVDQVLAPCTVVAPGADTGELPCRVASPVLLHLVLLPRCDCKRACMDTAEHTCLYLSV